MGLNPDFRERHKRWLEKSKDYDTSDINQCIDKFMTLYVTYNALYVEAAAYIHRKAAKEGTGGYKLKGDGFPDQQAATKYVLDILGSRKLLERLNNDSSTKQAIDHLVDLMERGGFNITLDSVWGEPDRDKDKELLNSLKSKRADEKARTILTIIYEVRCNLFHGRKGLHPVQKDLLVPLSILLETVIMLLYSDLQRAPYIEQPLSDMY
jgi:hypothetical protein